MAGDEVHEVAVGPVHAGGLSQGIFASSATAKTSITWNPLGYQHRGVERALVGGPDKRTIHYMETLAGDKPSDTATLRRATKP